MSARPDPTTGPSVPDGFIWGAATSAHQIEGGNVNNDWWDWEHNPDSGCVDVERRRVRLVPPLARRRQPRGGPRPGRLPLLVGVEPDRARRGGVLHGRPRPLPAHVRGMPRARRLAGGHLPPFLDAALAHRPRRLGGTRRPGAVRPLRRAHRRPSRRSHRMGVHLQRTQRGGRAGLHRRHLPAGPQGRVRPPLRRERRPGPGPPPGRRRPALGTGVVPRGHHAVDGGARGRRGRRGHAGRGRADPGEHLPRRHGRRRLHRRAVLRAHRASGPPGRSSPSPGRASPRWATSTGPTWWSTRCAAPPPTPGSPCS